eukprot:RCo042099
MSSLPRKEGSTPAGSPMGPPLEPFPFSCAGPPENRTPKAPQSVLRRPFWMLRLLCSTMTEGAYLADDVFVPKIVWYQEGSIALLPAVRAKIRYLEALAEMLGPLRRARLEDRERLREALKSFGAELEALNKQLSRESAASKPAKVQQLQQSLKDKSKLFKIIEKGTSILSLGSKKQQMCPEDAYVPQLQSVLTEVQFIDRWVEQLEASGSFPKNLAEYLRRVAESLSVGLCSFVLSDLTFLLNRYMESSRKECCRGLPKGFKAVLS